ncbi:hypothetical protein FIBSPDRAFT_882361 [Athelia psychrophila]|uniref:Uncharacterized protein n=1 Tax=Athelia psychrophila TaxID=1759441 RepID=A0A166V9I4_9AGAM|nr:hypothetical protein FIBSPDRAFT_882361 [Fibularhizoctonia sp. CBS 109695]
MLPSEAYCGGVYMLPSVWGVGHRKRGGYEPMPTGLRRRGNQSHLQQLRHLFGSLIRRDSVLWRRVHAAVRVGSGPSQAWRVRAYAHRAEEKRESVPLGDSGGNSLGPSPGASSKDGPVTSWVIMNRVGSANLCAVVLAKQQPEFWDELDTVHRDDGPKTSVTPLDDKMTPVESPGESGETEDYIPPQGAFRAGCSAQTGYLTLRYGRRGVRTNNSIVPLQSEHSATTDSFATDDAFAIAGYYSTLYRAVCERVFVKAADCALIYMATISDDIVRQFHGKQDDVGDTEEKFAARLPSEAYCGNLHRGPYFVVPGELNHGAVRARCKQAKK